MIQQSIGTFQQHTSLEREVRIETPEHVAVDYRLADLGSRFTALLIDGGILVAVLLFLLVGVPAILSRIGSVAGSWVTGWGMGAVILLSFALSWGYFVVFEAAWQGRTPGKRWMGIRVVHDGGFPLTLQGAAIRNLLRAIDSQPIFTWLIGGVTMLLSPHTKRLGDLAAGTIVVREPKELVIPEIVAAEAAHQGAPLLDEREFTALDTYVGRREGLAEGGRQRLAEKLAGRLTRKAEWRAEELTADEYLLNLHAAELARRSGASGAGAWSRSTELVRQQRERWQELQRLVERAGASRLASLSEAELADFAALYREATADLARARTYGASPQLLMSLERLVGSAHNQLYQPPRRRLSDLRVWVSRGFPALVRRRWIPIAVSATLFVVPAALGFGVARLDPGWARTALPAEMVRRAEEGIDREAQGRGYVEVRDVVMPVMASGLISNNVQVTFFAFAGGMIGGLGTAAILVLNGLFLGAVAGLFANHGLSLYLWTFVLPHGVIELTAIVIAGGAGLWLGSALLLPGRLTRREALEIRGREAVSLVAGTTLLLVVAGLIEGFISPSSLPRVAKLGLAALFALGLVGYLAGSMAGRSYTLPRRFTSR
ncbi:MAG TPA: stage II sporulation protein M [Longimicrobiaceae bacterium]